MITKMQQGDKTPQLYTHYGKQYEFGNLQREADQGLGEYLGSLKRGQKDANQFRKAYSDLMSGIGDGSITFSNGRFVDSKGRYTNYKDEDKDYYGLMANYIYSKMGRGQEYTPPEDTSKIKWGDGAGSQLFARKMFNSNTINVPYFIDLDPYDENTGKRGTQNRAQAVADLIQNELVNNYDTGFRDFTPEQKSSYLNYAQQALNAIQDGTIDSGDYLALYRIMPGIAWENMFSTQKDLQEQSISGTQDQQAQQTQQKSNETSSFEDYLNQKLPRKENSSSDLSLDESINYGDWTRGQLISSIKNMSDDTLYDYLQSIINNPDANFRYDQRFSSANRVSIPAKWLGTQILGRMAKEGKLVQDSSNPNIWYIPDLSDSQTNSGYYYDSENNTIYKRSLQDIPYFKDLLYKKWSGQDTSPYFTVAKKNGGILKAQTGTSFNNIYALGENPDISYNGYLNNIFRQQAVLDWMKGNYTGSQATQNYANYVKNNVNTRYSAGVNDFQNNPKYTGNDAIRSFNAGYQNNGNTLNYVLFGNSSDDYNNRTGGVAYSLQNFGRPNKPLRTGDSYNTDPSKAYIDNALGLQTYSRVASLTDPQLATGEFGQWGDYWKSQGNTGAYYYVAPGDTSNHGQWIPTSDTSIAGYVPFTEAAEETPDQVYDSSDIYLTESQKKQRNGSLNNFFQNLAPDLAGLNRLFLSLNTNNRVARTLNRTLRPVLRDTYERYSPVTGAFSEMQLRNRQAADLRRQAARPFTSDASLQLAGQLDANRQARELEHQGFLADDQEIRRTKAEALTRQEDNMARRSEVSNFNRASINQTNREKSQLEATRLKSNWQSIDNFLQGVESRLRYNTENRKNLSQQVALFEVLDEYQRSLDFLNQKFKEKYPNATASDMLNNSQYVDAVKKLRRRLRYENNNVLMNQYRIGQYGTPLSYTEILNNITFSKKGGQLHPSSMYLIDKVIRNESNS